MSVLPDHEIERWCERNDPPLISPLVAAQLQPASYDVLLGDSILIPTEHGKTVIVNNLRKEMENRLVDLGKPIPDDLYRKQNIVVEGHILFPGQFILASTMERVCIPTHMVGRIEGKSSLGRLGITAHITAGYLDPGFRGNVTLEILNVFTRPIKLWAGNRIAQLSFDTMHSTCRSPYGSSELGSHYQDAEGVEPTRYGA